MEYYFYCKQIGFDNRYKKFGCRKEKNAYRLCDFRIESLSGYILRDTNWHSRLWDIEELNRMGILVDLEEGIE